MSAEPVRNDLGQFAMPDAPPAPAAETTQAAPPPPVEQKHKVSVDGQEMEVGIDELRQGYMRLGTFTKRSQEVAERARLLEQREAALRSGFQPGFDTGVMQPYPTAGPNAGGNWPGVGGEVPFPPEQPAYRTTSAQAAPPPAEAYPSYGEPGEEYTRAQLQYLARQQAQIQAAVLAERQARQQMQAEQMQEMQVAQLANRVPGFNRAECDARFYMLPRHEQVYYENMPRAAAYELLHLKYGGSRTPPTGTPAAVPPVNQMSASVAPPPPDAGTPRSVNTGKAPLGPPPEDDPAALVAWFENAKAQGVRGL